MGGIAEVCRAESEYWSGSGNEKWRDWPPPSGQMGSENKHPPLGRAAAEAVPWRSTWDFSWIENLGYSEKLSRSCFYSWQRTQGKGLEGGERKGDRIDWGIEKTIWGWVGDRDERHWNWSLSLLRKGWIINFKQSLFELVSVCEQRSERSCWVNVSMNITPGLPSVLL